VKQSSFTLLSMLHSTHKKPGLTNPTTRTPHNRSVVSLAGATVAPASAKPMSAVVGCINYETNMIYAQRADGLIGLGNAPRALPAQVCGAVGRRLEMVLGLGWLSCAQGAAAAPPAPLLFPPL